MAKPEITAISTKLHDLLQPLEPALRKRAIKAALTMLGDEDMDDNAGKKKSEEEIHEDADLPSKAKGWLRTNAITQEQLNSVFHIGDGNVEIIAAEAPGKNGKEKTISAYILTGIGALLQTGDPKFDDKAGRAACDKLGCYQGTNHATIMKEKGNVLSGSKSVGWSLTGPGLKAGAELVKGLTAAT